MAKLWVLAVGGTGSSVLTSFINLLASGITVPNGFEICPVIIDSDSEGTEVVAKRTKDLVSNYVNCRNSLEEGIEQGIVSFFKTKCKEAKLCGVKDDFGHFGKYIGRNGEVPFHEDDAAFIDLLFSQGAGKGLNTRTNIGFIGQPNIGSVVMRASLGSNIEFVQFMEEFTDGDKIFIVGSIFGGTGAAGIPSIAKKLREQIVNGSRRFKNAPIAACFVLPYYAVMNDPNSPIDSDTYPTRAKIALEYYTENNSSDAYLFDVFYSIGDEDFNKVEREYKNVAGGAHQKNPPHVIEMMAANFIFDFAEREFVNNNNEYKNTEFIVFNDGMGDARMANYSFKQGSAFCLASNYRDSFISFLLLYRFFCYLSYCSDNKEFEPNFKHQPWAENNKLTEKFNQNSIVEKFLIQFTGWLKDMQDRRPYETKKTLSDFNINGNDFWDVIRSFLYEDDKNINGKFEGLNKLSHCLNFVEKNKTRDYTQKLNEINDTMTKTVSFFQKALELRGIKQLENALGG